MMDERKITSEMMTEEVAYSMSKESLRVVYNRLKHKQLDLIDFMRSKLCQHPQGLPPVEDCFKKDCLACEYGRIREKPYWTKVNKYLVTINIEKWNYRHEIDDIDEADKVERELDSEILSKVMPVLRGYEQLNGLTYDGNNGWNYEDWLTWFDYGDEATVVVFCSEGMYE